MNKFKAGDIVEVKLSKYLTEVAEVVSTVIRDGKLRYQISYPHFSSSQKFYTEQDPKNLKISSYDKLKN